MQCGRSSVNLSINCTVYSQNNLDFTLRQKIDMAKAQNYSERLNQVVVENSEVARFRRLFPTKFAELCKVHLSFLLDIPSNFLDDENDLVYTWGSNGVSESTSSGPGKWGPHSLSRWFHQAAKNALRSQHQALTDEVVDNLVKLLTFLEGDSCLETEGLFRKSGNLTRQRDLKERLFAGQDIVPILSHLESQQGFFVDASSSTLYSVHDMAGALKSFLSELKQPLLTARFLPLFTQVAALIQPKQDENGIAVPLQDVDRVILKGKQLKALRILCLLLPPSNRRLLKHLLRLLNRVSERPQNRMSAESLGTLFGPLLLTQRKTSSKELKSAYPVLNQLATLLIEKGEDLFLLPRTLSEDIAKNLHKLTTHRRMNAKRKSNSETSLHAYRILKQSLQVDNNNSTCDSTKDDRLTPEHQLKLIRHPTNGNISDDMIDESLDTCIAFVDRRPLETATSDYPSLQSTPIPCRTRQHCPQSSISSNMPLASLSSDGDCLPAVSETEYAVAELYARVQALPESAQKRRLVVKFNQVNGGGLVTPTRGSGTGGSFVRGGVLGAAFNHYGIRSSLKKRLAVRSQVSMPSHHQSKSSRTIKSPSTSEKSSSSLMDAVRSLGSARCQLTCIKDTSVSSNRSCHLTSQSSSSVSLHSTSLSDSSRSPTRPSNSKSADMSCYYGEQQRPEPEKLDSEIETSPTSCSPFRKRWRCRLGPNSTTSSPGCMTSVSTATTPKMVRHLISSPLGIQFIDATNHSFSSGNSPKITTKCTPKRSQLCSTTSTHSNSPSVHVM